MILALVENVMKRWLNSKTLGGTLIAGMLLVDGGCGLLTTRNVATFAAKEVGKKAYEKFKEDREEQNRDEMTHSDGVDDEGVNGD